MENTDQTSDEPNAETQTDPSTSEPGGPGEPAGERTDRVWAGRFSEGTIEVELGRHDAFDTKALAELFEGPEASASISVPADQAPGALRDVTTLEVLTPGGIVRTDIDAYHRKPHSRRDGHAYSLETEPIPDDTTVGRWVLVAPRGTFHESARLRNSDPEPASDAVRRGLREAFLGEIDDAHREEVAGHLSERHFQAVEGRFPGPHRRVVLVNLLDDPEWALLNAAYLTAEAGSVTAILDPPRFDGAHGPIRIVGAADLDGDGIESILFYEQVDGYKVSWLHFRDGSPVVDVLAGFSA